MASSRPSPRGPAEFPSTSWSALRQLRDEDEEAAREPLARLAQLYWKPIHCVIRHRWSRSPDEAKDLTQEFFATVLLDREVFRRFAPDRGSFRSFLKGALDNFMSNFTRAAGRLKRGGGVPVVSLDGDAPDLATLAPGLRPQTPDEVFDLAWDAFVMRQAIDRVRARLEAEGHADHFEALRRFDLAGEPRPTYDELARELGWTVRKLRRTLTSVRGLLRAALSDLVCEYVDGPEALAEELRRLVGG